MLPFSNMLGFKEILLNLGKKKVSSFNFTSLKPKCLDLANVTPLNKSILNVWFFFVFEPTRNNVLKLPLATLMIPLSFLGQSADLKKCSIPFVFISPPCQKDFLILLVPAREMLQNTIQILH